MGKSTRKIDRYQVPWWCRVSPLFQGCFKWLWQTSHLRGNKLPMWSCAKSTVKICLNVKVCRWTDMALSDKCGCAGNPMVSYKMNDIKWYKMFIVYHFKADSGVSPNFETRSFFAEWCVNYLVLRAPASSVAQVGWGRLFILAKLLLIKSLWNSLDIRLRFSWLHFGFTWHFNNFAKNLQVYPMTAKAIIVHSLQPRSVRLWIWLVRLGIKTRHLKNAQKRKTAIDARDVFPTFSETSFYR